MTNFYLLLIYKNSMNTASISHSTSSLVFNVKLNAAQLSKLGTQVCLNEEMACVKFSIINIPFKSLLLY